MPQMGNWPVLQYLVGFGSSPYTPSGSITWTDITQYVEGPLSIQRGQQYELAQTQTGQATLTIRNWDGRFDPLNTAGPYYPLKVWTPIQIKAGSSLLFTGFIERWPQTWSATGDRRGTAQITIVDAFAILSQRDMWAAMYHAVAGYDPFFLYTMDDQPSSGAQQFADFMGGKYLSTTASGWGVEAAGSVGLGTTVTAGTTMSDMPQGLPGPVSTIALDSTATSGQGGLSMPPITTSPAGGAWTFIVAMEMSGVPGGDTVDLMSISNQASGVLLQYLNGKVSLIGSAQQSAWTQLPVGMALFIVEAAAPAAGAQLVTVTWGTGPGQSVSVDQDLPSGPTIPLLVYQQTVATTAKVNVALCAAINGNPVDHDYLFREFYGGYYISSGSRFSSILSAWGGWPGGSIVDNYASGQTPTVGYPVEMLAAASGDGNNMLQLLQTVVDTEAGNMYVDVSGNIVFRARRHRIVTPDNPIKATIGEAGVPYTQATLDYDPTHITNSLLVTQTVGNATYRVANSTSVGEYGTVSMSRSVNTTDWQNIIDGAAWILYQYSEPVPYGTATIDLAGQSAAAWASALTLELGDHITFTRKPVGAPEITFDAVVEQIGWNIDGTGKAVLTLGFESAAMMNVQMVGQSPILTTQTGTLAGSLTMVLNPMSDAATNGLDANLGPGAVRNGMAQCWYVDDPGSEEIIIFTSVPHTGTGYTSATVQVESVAYLSGGVWQVVAPGFGIFHGHNAGVQLIDAGALETVYSGGTAGNILGSEVQIPPGPWGTSSTSGRVAGY